MPSQNIKKRAQVGETVTWIVATIVIIAVLAAAIFLVSFYSDRFKKIQEPYSQTADVLASKSLFSYLVTSEDGSNIYTLIKDSGRLEDTSGNLALRVFSDTYKREYPGKIWLGFVSAKPGTEGLSVENSYFGKRTFGLKEEFNPSDGTQEVIVMDQNSSLNLLLIK